MKANIDGHTVTVLMSLNWIFLAAC